MDVRLKATSIHQHAIGMRENYGNSGGNSGAIQGNSGAFSAIRVPGGCQNARHGGNSRPGEFAFIKLKGRE